MAIQRSQWEQHGTVVLALPLNVYSLPFFGLVITLIFILGIALHTFILKEKFCTVMVSGSNFRRCNFRFGQVGILLTERRSKRPDEATSNSLQQGL